MVLESPPLAGAASWDSMFITSTSRLVLPVDSLELPDGRVLTFQRNELLERLKAQTAAEIRSRSERLM